jgi:hypothetical protein
MQTCWPTYVSTREAATLVALRLARALDEGETEFLRLATPVARFWVCKVTPWLVAKALECIHPDWWTPLQLLLEDSNLAHSTSSYDDNQRIFPLPEGLSSELPRFELSSWTRPCANGSSVAEVAPGLERAVVGIAEIDGVSDKMLYIGFSRPSLLLSVFCPGGRPPATSGVVDQLGHPGPGEPGPFGHRLAGSQ